MLLDKKLVSYFRLYITVSEMFITFVKAIKHCGTSLETQPARILSENKKAIFIYKSGLVIG